jgi:hypothetical protein
VSSRSACSAWPRTRRPHADPARVGALVHGHWAIEANHWIRDSVTMVDPDTPGKIINEMHSHRYWTVIASNLSPS